jgi:3-dehydroquinate synthase
MKTLHKYSVHIGKESLDYLQQFIANNNYSGVVVLTDENTHKHCYPLLKGSLSSYNVINVKSGEGYKNLSTCLSIWQQLSDLGCDRKTLLINLGGGVLCDMGGFVAVTYLRGIDFVHIPTTLLSMSDACIGGKLGVNFNGIKNQIGMFHNPKAVFINVDFLKTLSEKHYLSGYAEIIKHALIASVQLFSKLIQSGEYKENIEKLVTRSIKIKSSIVCFDPLEKGRRKALNFGHSIGHALESFFIINNHRKPVYHGEAVAAGMIAESWISWKRNFISIEELEMISSLILRFFPKLNISKEDIPKIAANVKMDKKNEYNQKLFILLNGIGQCRINEIVTDEEIMLSLEYYLSL